MKSRSGDQILTLITIALTFGSGATGVSAFTRLGGVFTSVMTGNIVFFGLSVAEQSVSLASRAGCCSRTRRGPSPALALTAMVTALVLARFPVRTGEQPARTEE